MSQIIKRTLAVVVLAFGCMVVANAHQACEEQRSRAGATPVEDLHMHAEVNSSETKKTISEAKVKSVAPALAPAVPQTDPKEGGDGCLRASCNCTSSTHNNPYCRPSGGDCANHPGLLCIW